MSASWSPEQRARQSAKMSKIWQARVRADPNAHKLARARALRNLTQTSTAELAVCAANTVSEIEARHEPASRRMRERLARALALPEEALFDD